MAGVLDNGQFTALLTDPRGTPFASPDGTAYMATPYGVRASRLAVSEVVDYARLGWDPDLEVVRMGVRDYAPKLGPVPDAGPAVPRGPRDRRISASGPGQKLHGHVGPVNHIPVKD